MKNTEEIASPETTECYENIMGKATSPSLCRLLCGLNMCFGLVWPIFILCPDCILEYIFSSATYGAMQTSLTSRICIDDSDVECTWMKLGKITVTDFGSNHFSRYSCCV